MIKGLKTKNVFLLLLVAVLFLFIINFVSASCDSSQTECEQWQCDAQGNQPSGATWIPHTYAFDTGTVYFCCGDLAAEVELYRYCYYNQEPYGCTTNYDDVGCIYVDYMNHCVYNNQIYNQGSVITNPAYSSGVGQDNKIYCQSTTGGGNWADCDSYTSQGGYFACASSCGANINSGEITGEYSSVGAGGCCGDDDNEYSVNTDCDGNTVTAKCCSSSTDKIEGGVCVDSCGVTPTCSENDGGNFPNTFGTVTGVYSNGNSYSIDDSCENADIIHERYCSGTTPTTSTQGCLTGRSCSSGACQIICGDGLCHTQEEREENYECEADCGPFSGTYCGDLITQSPNDAGTGGPLNDGYEDCDDGSGGSSTCETWCEFASSTYSGTCEGPCTNGGFGEDAGCESGLWCQNYDGSTLCRSAGGACDENCDCVNGQECISGSCQTPASDPCAGLDECSLGPPIEQFCSSSTQYRSCYQNSTGCLVWGSQTTCPDSGTCSLDTSTNPDTIDCSGCTDERTDTQVCSDAGYECSSVLDNCGDSRLCGTCSVGTCNTGTGQCETDDCGNGVVDSGETCDGTNLNGMSCTDIDAFTGGTLSCDSNCLIDTNSCTGGTIGICGDGVVNIGETCDGGNLDGKTCFDFDDFTGGYITCDSNCDIDTSLCNTEICTLSSISWNDADLIAYEGEQLSFTIQGSNCLNNVMEVYVWENDPTDDLITENPITFVMGSATEGGASWTAADWFDDNPLPGFEDNPEYYLKVNYLDQEQQSLDIEIKANWEDYCAGPPEITVCGQYLERSKCNVDGCEVAQNSVPEQIDCNEDGINCGCSWVGTDESGSCAATFSSGNIGTCYLQEIEGSSNCEESEFLTYSWTALWNWIEGNTFGSDPDPGNNDYWENTSSGTWHYDPINLFTGTNKSVQCQPGENIIACPAQIQLPFFNWYNVVVTLIVIILIYIIINSASKKKLVKKKRKVKKKKK